MFYPDDPEELRSVVTDLMAAAERRPETQAAKAVIAPHAGYIYSGPIAANAYARLEPAKGQIERVVLLGPSHRYGFKGLAVSHADKFATPLGDVEIDTESEERALALRQVHFVDEAHAAEHSLEVHLPFIQLVLGDVKVVPFSVGDSSPEQVGEVIDLLWGGPETVVIVSSDLSHYYDYETACRLDQSTSTKIVDLDFELIGQGDACGRAPIRGLLLVARERGLNCELLDLRNSGDTAGTRAEVVGYGSYALA